MHTLRFFSAEFAICKSLQAVDKPAGPAPTITTSTSMDSRCIELASKLVLNADDKKGGID
jgi:hypothetical protein